MKVLLLATGFNSLTQRVYRELEIMGIHVAVETTCKGEVMEKAVKLFSPDLIICPFLKHRVPESIWSRIPCLIVHPGIEGDRGPSSIDWALANKEPRWGVTLLEAAEEMDTGDIWGTLEFPMRKTTKGGIYRREVTQAAIKLIKNAVKQFLDKNFKPRPLDYSASHVQGQWRDPMPQSYRTINWQQNTAVEIVEKINAADGAPGVKNFLLDQNVYLYGASIEPDLTGKPGQILAKCHDAICIAASDSSVWVRQIKPLPAKNKLTFKLAASTFIQQTQPRLFNKLDTVENDNVNDIWFRNEGNVGYLYFNFYNGAMSTQQCLRLKQRIMEAKASGIRVLVLMGGEQFWSNGIHLNYIENAPDPAVEAWENIQAMDDVVEEIINSPDILTVAAVRCNAGAGGAIMTLACDKVVLRDGVVLNPHYQSMGLYGSEYWTYLLPKKVGAEQARKLTSECLPLLATEALTIGFGDELFDEDWINYHQALNMYCSEISTDKHFDDLIRHKNKIRERDEQEKPLEEYRTEELDFMRNSFFHRDSSFHQLRKNFVYKTGSAKIPSKLQPQRVIGRKKVAS